MGSPAAEIGRILDAVDIDPHTKAILVGRHYAIDGYAPKPVRIVTHIHSDHVLGLEASARDSVYIVGTPLTLDLIEAIGRLGDGAASLFSIKKRPVNYGEQLTYQGTRVTLIECDHVPGSAQVLIELEGLKVGYTGDFRLGGRTKVMRGLDALVIEATYGSPNHRRAFKKSVPELFLDVVRYGLREYGRVVVYGYHGKLQEAMLLLREGGIDATFYMPESVYRATRVLEKHGIKVGNYALGLPGNGEPQAVVFRHFNSARSRRLDGSVLNVVLSGWEFSEPVRRLDDHTWLVALSDHADFEELVEYVERAAPGVVIVDGSRSGSPHELAGELIKRGYPALVMPRGGRP